MNERDRAAAAAAHGSDAAQHDVVITGGGLAGLTLALQLKQRFADLDILVLERRVHPVPVAAHKVGESTVEIGAQLLRRGARAEGAPRTRAAAEVRLSLLLVRTAGDDVDRVTEIGASRCLAVPSYQIDRGIFENFLGEEARAARRRASTCGATVRDIALAEWRRRAPRRLRPRRRRAATRARAGWSTPAAAPA